MSCFHIFSTDFWEENGLPYPLPFGKLLAPEDSHLGIYSKAAVVSDTWPCPKIGTQVFFTSDIEQGACR